MKKTLIIAAALVAMAACNKDIIDYSTPAEYGYISLGVSADTEMVVTKAESAPLTAEQLKDYTVSLEGTKESWTSKYSAADWKVAAGTDYVLSLQNLTVAEAYASENGLLRLAGASGTLEVKAGKTTECSVKCTPANAKVSFLYTPEFAAYFNTSAVTMSNVVDGDYPARSLEMTMAATADAAETAFAEASEHTWTLEVESELYGEKTYTKDFTPRAASWTQITFDVNAADGSLNITVTVDDEITEVYEITATIDPTDDSVVVM